MKKINECIDYFKALRLSDGTLVVASNRKMPLCVLILNLMSVKQMEGKCEVNYILTRRTSQDHLELFFFLAYVEEVFGCADRKITKWKLSGIKYQHATSCHYATTSIC